MQTYVFPYSSRSQVADIYLQMSKARCLVFKDRLGWDVQDNGGLEVDEFDTTSNPLYFVVADNQGQHIASLRLLPCSGPTMLTHVFRDFFPEGSVRVCGTSFECTRLCLYAPGIDEPLRRIGMAQLCYALSNYALSQRASGIIGVYYSIMRRVYLKVGWEPNTLLSSKKENKNIELGRWSVSEDVVSSLGALCWRLSLDIPIYNHVINIG